MFLVKQQNPLPSILKTCKEFSDLIIDRLKEQAGGKDELHVVFDTCSKFTE